jgi:hypothetical protein
MQGTRLQDGFEAKWDPIPGAFWKTTSGTWYAWTPNGMLANLSNHEIVEHEDRTITVSPSILTTSGHAGTRWHGYLVRGVWREVA